MKTYKISVAIFYDKNNILLQDRKDFRIIRFGEEYGFFGGGIKEGETPKQALIREISEELNIKIKNYKFFKKYIQKFKEHNAIVERHVFIAPMPDVENLKVDEGKAFVTKFEKSFDLKMMPGDKDILKEIYQSLHSQKI